MDAPAKTISPVENALRTLGGAAVGGAAGYVVFGWMVSQGFYAPAIPGVALGVCGGWMSRARSLPLAVACGVAGGVLGLIAEWRHFPFVADKSLGYFLAHLTDLQVLTWIMVLLGGFAGFWFVWRSDTATGNASGK